MQYQLKLMETEAGIGYFACIPENNIDFNSALSYARKCPYDEFMRRYLLEVISKWDEKYLDKFIQDTDKNDNYLKALLYEACLLYEKFNKLIKFFKNENNFLEYTPLIYIKSNHIKNQILHYKWIRIFRKNIIKHHILPSPDKVGLPFPFSQQEISDMQKHFVTIDEVYNKLSQQPLPLNIKMAPPRPSPEETTQNALEKLEKIDVIAEQEMRHVASLSPIALLRKWNVNIFVNNGRHNYQFSGIQTSYGRGLDLEPARAALTMEMVERCSSFASFDKHNIKGYINDYPLIRGSYTELKNKEILPVNPNSLALEAPYNDEPLYWIQGTKQTDKGPKPVLIPAQCIFLFCNLDEIQLFSSLGSTGLASGNTMEEAKVSALTEIIERDSEGVMPFTHEQCFNLESSDEKLASLLGSYLKTGIRIQFQDITLPMGVPCCKCFVITRQGEIIKGTGASLNAGKALLSAMTETPYPFPYGDPSNPGLQGLMRVPFENLPDYSMGNSVLDLLVLETLLNANKYEPVYVDLTRKDINIPVVRAVIPGMEITGDFDRFSRVHPRLFANYLKIFKGKLFDN